MRSELGPCSAEGHGAGIVAAVLAQCGGRGRVSDVVTVYGVLAVSFMMLMYALESRGRRFVLAFAVGCLLSSLYGFLSGAWPFGVVELVWCGIALRRYRKLGIAA